MAEQTTTELDQGIEIARAVVHSLNEEVLERYPAIGALDVMVQRFLELRKRLLSDLGHELVSRGLHCRVQ